MKITIGQKQQCNLEEGKQDQMIWSTGYKTYCKATVIKKKKSMDKYN